MTYEMAVFYYICAGLVFAFTLGIYIGAGIFTPARAMWSIFFGLFWPLTCIMMITYPLWRKKGRSSWSA